jgi:hypothetical protein
MDEKICELRDTVRELLQNIIKRIDDITVAYNNDGDFETDRLQNLFDDLNSLAEGISIMKMYYPDLDLSEFQEKTEMMESAIEVHDTMLLSDLLRFELKDLLIFWEKCLAS